jgi:hypothetical protein
VIKYIITGILMKNLTLVFCLIFSFQSVAQTIDGSDSLDSTFSETPQLTDQQADEAATFVHQGLKDKAIQEGCDNKTLKGCDGSSARPGLEDQIGKMYAVIFGLGPMLMKGSGGGSSSGGQTSGGTTSGGTTSGGTTTGTSGGTSGTEAGETKKTDYCIYIPIAYEGLSFLLQSSGQKQAQQDSANLDPQLASLVQLKEAHKTRKKTATQQSVVYGVTGACYAAQMFMGQTNTMTIVKMGAAGALSLLYMSKAKKHGKAADMVQAVIDGLPKAGDCNPWTGTACFCSEKTSAKLYPGQYQEVCVLNKGNFNGPLANDGCAVQVAGKISLDATCGCKATNTCLSSKISLGKSSLGLGANFVNDANKGLALLDPSQFDEAKLADFSSAMAAKLSKVPVKNVPDVKLTPAQKALADEMSKVAPASIAALAAASPTGAPPVGGLMGGGTSSALDKLPDSLKKDMKDFEVSGSYRKNGGFSPTSAAAEPGFSIPGLGGPQQPQGGVKVEEYAAKAMNNADVRNSPDVAIFDIISNRYRSSAWKRLDTEGK